MHRSLIRVNSADGTIGRESVEGDDGFLGGRSLTSHVVAREVPPLCHPLGAGNRLVIAPGLLSGTTCVNTSRLSIDAMVQMVNARFDGNVDLESYGREILAVEREFNKRSGIGPQHDRLPAFFDKEPLPPHQAVFDVPDDEIDGVFK